MKKNENTCHYCITEEYWKIKPLLETENWIHTLTGENSLEIIFIDSFGNENYSYIELSHCPKCQRKLKST